jgi:hypothetical protein
MTKDELIALARGGKAHIEETSTYLVTRYQIVADVDADGLPAIYAELSEVGVEHAYYTDGSNEHELTPDEGNEVWAAIDTALSER